MSFHNTAPCFLTFYRSDQSLLLFKFKIFVLNTSIISPFNHLSSLYTAVPVIDTPSSSTVTIDVGDPLTLSCTSQGSPPDTFTWRKDNGPLIQSTNITAVDYNSTSAVFRANYFIASVTTSNNGTYTCNVTNPMGNNSTTITVVVIGK